MYETNLLISVHPQYAEKIFAGTKTVELRKNRPRRLKEGDRVIIYVSYPTMAILGGFSAAEIIETTPDELWQLVQDSSGLSRNEYDSYYSDSLAAIAIMVNDPWKLEQPVTLATLKNIIPDFHPPQIFRYLSQDECEEIFQLLKIDSQVL